MERQREKKRKISVGFLSLDIGNENHIGVLVINLCHNSPKMLDKKCSVKYDSVMASCCSHNVFL